VSKHRLVSPQAQPEDPEQSQLNAQLRPTRITEYVGQTRLLERLRIALEAAQQRDEPMEHVLLHGPPGLGKTTLAHVIAAELGAHMVRTAGPALSRPTDLVGTLTKLQPRDVLFIDEIHRLPPVVEEYIYPAMEDFKVDVMVDSGMHARTITLPVKPFCLIGATTRAGLLSGPMRSRFGLTHSLEFYNEAELLTMLRRSAALLGAEGAGGEAIDDAALAVIAARSRGTPRIANRLLRRVRDYAQVRHAGAVTPDAADDALQLEGVDALGLDELDRKYLRTIAKVYRGGPVGLEAIAATLAEDAGTLEDMVEPYLLQLGFLARTRKGRQLTPAAASHLGLDPSTLTPPDDDTGLFGG